MKYYFYACWDIRFHTQISLSLGMLRVCYRNVFSVYFFLSILMICRCFVYKKTQSRFEVHLFPSRSRTKLHSIVKKQECSLISFNYAWGISIIFYVQIATSNMKETCIQVYLFFENLHRHTVTQEISHGHCSTGNGR